jgi:hypothetical protein
MHVRNALVRPPPVVVGDVVVLGVDAADTALAEDEWSPDEEHAVPARVSAATIAAPNPSFVVPRRYAG